MFSHVMIGSNDISAARKFYDAVLATVGVSEGDFNEEAQRIYYRTLNKDQIFPNLMLYLFLYQDVVQLLLVMNIKNLLFASLLSQLKYLLELKHFLYYYLLLPLLYLFPMCYNPKLGM